MALFSPSESVYFASFLSAVDLDSSITPDGSVDPSVADRVPHLQGRESLAKRTKDLMSLDVPVSSAHHLNALHGTHPAHIPNLPSNNPSYWPSIPGAESGSSRLSAPADRPPERPTVSDRSFSTIFPAAERNPSQPPHAHVPTLRNYDPSGSSAGPGAGSGYTLPPMPVASFAGVKAHDGRAQARSGPVPSSASAPSMQSSTSAKRPLPTSATDPGSSSKRARSSPSSSAPASASAPDADSPSGTGSGPARPRRGGPSQTQAQSRGTLAPNGSSTSNSNAAANGGANANGKGTLLSPSQKRANHIQSEQKRRANIRRGYESLCEVVPALREAIKAEEERERAKTRERDLDGLEDVDGKASSSSRTRGGEKGKKKGRGEVEKADGRAGPRSENVVLQKTIDYITGLIAERSALQQRLELARGMLPLGHSALPVELGHLDASGVPLWEREWNGGMDLDLADFGGAPEDDGGSEDEG
ncbi:transcription factor [Ganoderma sinense ZZ0214-1]|uniref:Transcription factor n=1 Tax=Ganoderma sinense ZZ0214-1 TaxID=1077348 RepID=A0A2G8SPP4_9APHY|nr:transcription factor [Ganoderma sinense ZZ0214-1]